jgi:hypothetical protein
LYPLPSRNAIIPREIKRKEKNLCTASLPAG